MTIKGRAPASFYGPKPFFKQLEPPRQKEAPKDTGSSHFRFLLTKLKVWRRALCVGDADLLLYPFRAPTLTGQSRATLNRLMTAT